MGHKKEEEHKRLSDSRGHGGVEVRRPSAASALDGASPPLHLLSTGLPTSLSTTHLLKIFLSVPLLQFSLCAHMKVSQSWHKSAINMNIL